MGAARDIIGLLRPFMDAFMDLVCDFIPVDGPITCSHDGTCEERFHEAQVALENEERDDCASCQKLVVS